MDVPMEVTFRNMEKSEALEAQVQEHAARLERYYDHIVACRVAIEAPHRQHHKGNLFHVRVDITVPEGELVASRDPAGHHAHEDAYVALRDAFKAVERQLQEYAEKRRADVKSHGARPRGFIAVLDRESESGRIDTVDGRSIYFHRNAVKGDYDQLQVGWPVSFEMEDGDEGPQATMVQLEG